MAERETPAEFLARMQEAEAPEAPAPEAPAAESPEEFLTRARGEEIASLEAGLEPTAPPPAPPPAQMPGGVPPPASLARELKTSAGALVSGLGQGATLGFGEEIAASLEATGTWLGDVVASAVHGTEVTAQPEEIYEQARDELRQELKEAEEANPYAYAAGELTGGIAATMVPGVGAARAAAPGVRGVGAAERLARAAKLTESAVKTARWGGGVLRGAGIAGVYGMGKSEAEELGQIIEEGRMAAGVGGLAGVALPLAFKGAEKLGKAALKGIKKQIRTETIGAATEAQKKAFGYGKERIQNLDDFLEQNKEITKVAARDADAAADIASARAYRIGEEVLTEAGPIHGRNVLKHAQDTVLKGAKKSDIAAMAGKKNPKQGVDDFFRKHPDLAEEVVNQDVAADMAQRRVDSLFAQRVNPAHDLIERVDVRGGVPMTRIMQKLGAVKRQFQKPGIDPRIAKAVDNLQEQIRAQYMGTNVRKGISHIPIREAREMTTNLQKMAFAGDPFDQAIMREMRNDVAGAVRGAMDDYLETALRKKVPFSKQTIGQALQTRGVADIKQANKDISELIGFKNTMQRKGFAAAAKPPPKAIDEKAAIKILEEQGTAAQKELATQHQRMNALREMLERQATKQAEQGIAPRLKLPGIRDIALAPITLPYRAGRMAYRGLGRFQLARQKGLVPEEALELGEHAAQKETRAIGMDPFITEDRGLTAAGVAAAQLARPR